MLQAKIYNVFTSNLVFWGISPFLKLQVRWRKFSLYGLYPILSLLQFTQRGGTYGACVLYCGGGGQPDSLCKNICFLTYLPLSCLVANGSLQTSTNYSDGIVLKSLKEHVGPEKGDRIPVCMTASETFPSSHPTPPLNHPQPAITVTFLALAQLGWAIGMYVWEPLAVSSNGLAAHDSSMHFSMLDGDLRWQIMRSGAVSPWDW